MPESSQSDLQLKKQRRRSVLFWIFVTISVPIAVILVGYAAGYRIDPETRTVIGSSAVAVDTTPAGAAVLLNGETLNDTTPLIQTIAPGEYSIDIQYDRYHPWRKTVSFEEGKSLIFPDVILFPQSEPVRISAAPIEAERFEPLPNSYRSYYKELGWSYPRELLAQSGPLQLLIDEKNGTSYLLDAFDRFNDERSIDGVVSAADWNSERVLAFSVGVELWIYDSRKNEFTLLFRQSCPLNDVAWHPDGGYIFYSDRNGVFVIEVDPRDKRQIWQLAELPSPSSIEVDQQGSTLQIIANGSLYELALE